MEKDLFSTVRVKPKRKSDTKRVIRIDSCVLEEIPPLSLFEGFNSFKAVTFSSSLSMLTELLEKGYKDIKLLISLPEDFKETKELELLKFFKENGNELNRNLLNGLNNIDFSVKYLPKSHSKVYILSSETGKRRLILGSLNLSKIAWEGKQNEEVTYTDKEDLIEYYDSLFNKLFLSAREIVSNKTLKKVLDKKGMKNVVINEVNIDTKDGMEKLKQVKDIADGMLIKNLTVALNPNPQMLKRQIERVKKDFGQVSTIALKVADAKQQVLLSPPGKVVKIFDGEFTPSSSAKSLYYNVKENYWERNDIAVVRNTSREKAIENLKTLKQILEALKEHGGTKETERNILEAVLFGFAGSYLWAVRQKDDMLPENYPIFGILAGTTKAGKSLTLSIVSQLIHGENLTIEYSRKPTLNGYEYSLGNSKANIFEEYFDGMLPFARGILPVLVNEVSESHLKDKKLYSLVKYYSNTRIPNQHGVAFMSMNISFCLMPEIARRVFFLEYNFSLKDHKKLERKLRPLVRNLDTSLFFYFLESVNPLEVEADPEDPLIVVRNFLKDLSKEEGMELPISDEYIGDVESKGISELRHVMILSRELETFKHPTKNVECYVIEKEKFRYPPPSEVVIEDKGNYYYLNAKLVDRICKKEGNGVIRMVKKIFGKK